MTVSFLHKIIEYSATRFILRAVKDQNKDKSMVMLLNYTEKCILDLSKISNKILYESLGLSVFVCYFFILK